MGGGGEGKGIEKRERLSNNKKKRTKNNNNKKNPTNQTKNTEVGHPPKHQDLRVHSRRGTRLLASRPHQVSVALGVAVEHQSVKAVGADHLRHVQVLQADHGHVVGRCPQLQDAVHQGRVLAVGSVGCRNVT